MSHTIEPTEIDTKKPDSSHIERVATEDLGLGFNKTGDPLVSDFPEGGYRAWMAVAGAFLCLFVGGVVCLPEGILSQHVELTSVSSFRNIALGFSLHTTPLTS
jgi:hypothetical protein